MTVEEANRVLGLSENNTNWHAVRMRYAKLIFKYHPDTTDLEDLSVAGEEMTCLLDAYRFLEDAFRGERTGTGNAAATDASGARYVDQQMLPLQGQEKAYKLEHWNTVLPLRRRLVPIIIRFIVAAMCIVLLRIVQR